MSQETITRSDLVNAIHQSIKIKKNDASTLLDNILECVISSARDTGEFRFHNFGTFSVKERAERQARNPQTGEAITVAACNVISFKAASALKESVAKVKLKAA